MEVTFIRTGTTRYASRARRVDGVTVHVPGYENPVFLPHDLAHFLVEREYMPDGGFWVCVAAGAMFSGMYVLSGRQRPHARERSRAVLRAARWTGTNAECLVGVLHRIAHERLDETWHVAEALLRREWRCREAARRDLTAADVHKVCTELRSAADPWAALPVAGELTFLWHSSSLSRGRAGKYEPRSETLARSFRRL